MAAVIPDATGDVLGSANPEVLARAIAAASSDHASRAEGSPLDDAAFAELVRLVEDHRLLGGLMEGVERGAIAITDSQRELLRVRHRVWATNGLRVERLLEVVTECFERAGIESRVLKGPALAHSVYGDPAWRVFGDLDLLIAPRDLDAAVRLVVDELGGDRTIAELRPGFDREFGKEVMARVDGLELDLHRTLVSGPFGLTIDLENLASNPGEVVVGGRRYATLSPVARYLHACYNLALGDQPPRLGGLRDLLLVDRLGDVTPDAVIETARRWQGTAVVNRAATLVRDLASERQDSTILEELSRLTPPPRERAALHTYLSSTASYRRQVASLLVIPGVRARGRYLWPLLSPSRDYLVSRGWTETSHVRRAARRILGRVDA